jgi:hypothetical protein
MALGIALAAASAAMPLDDAAGGDWYARAALSQQVEYDDNIGLSARKRDRMSALGETSSIDATVGGRSATALLEVASRLNFTRFPSERQLNSNDQYITVSAGRQGQRSSVLLKGQLIRDTTRTSDLDDTGVFIQQNRRREVYRIGPEVSHQLTPVDQLIAGADYTNVHYPSGNLGDYRQFGGRIGWNRALSPRTQFVTNMSAFQLSSNSQGSQDSVNIGALLGFRHLFTDKLEATLLAGPSVSRTATTAAGDGFRQSQTDVSVGYLLDASLRYAAEKRLTLESGVSRTVSPSSSTGLLIEDTSFRNYARYELFPNVYADMVLSYSMRETVGQGVDTDRRDYVAVEPGLRWRFAEDWEMALGYRYRWQAFDRGREEADSSAVVFSLTYQRPPWSLFH